MSLTVQQLLADARRLSTRLRDHDQSADQLISRTQEVLKEVEAMRQYQEDVENLNEVAHNRPRAHLVLGIQQENRHIRTLQQENKELRSALEEHQNALELIMSKYREHVTRLVSNPHKTEGDADINVWALRERTEKVCEMAAVMKVAVKMEEEREGEQQELIARLVTENKGLRELLEISQKNSSIPKTKRIVTNSDQSVQTEPPATCLCRDRAGGCSGCGGPVGGVTTTEDGLDLHVTLPRPVAPPRGITAAANRNNAAGVGGSSSNVARTPRSERNISESSPEPDFRATPSPVIDQNSASESDETSDDDSIKYDTIKLANRHRGGNPTAYSITSNQPANTNNNSNDSNINNNNIPEDVGGGGEGGPDPPVVSSSAVSPASVSPTSSSVPATVESPASPSTPSAIPPLPDSPPSALGEDGDDPATPRLQHQSPSPLTPPMATSTPPPQHSLSPSFSLQTPETLGSPPAATADDPDAAKTDSATSLSPVPANCPDVPVSTAVTPKSAASAPESCPPGAPASPQSSMQSQLATAGDRLPPTNLDLVPSSPDESTDAATLSPSQVDCEQIVHDIVTESMNGGAATSQADATAAESAKGGGEEESGSKEDIGNQEDMGSKKEGDAMAEQAVVKPVVKSSTGPAAAKKGPGGGGGGGPAAKKKTNPGRTSPTKGKKGGEKK